MPAAIMIARSTICSDIISAKCLSVFLEKDFGILSRVIILSLCISAELHTAMVFKFAPIAPHKATDSNIAI